MPKVHARFWGLALLAALFALGAISLAAAAPPTTSTTTVQGTQLLADCGAFKVFDDYAGTIGHPPPGGQWRHGRPVRGVRLAAADRSLERARVAGAPRRTRAGLSAGRLVQRGRNSTTV